MIEALEIESTYIEEFGNKMHDIIIHNVDNIERDDEGYAYDRAIGILFWGAVYDYEYMHKKHLGKLVQDHESVYKQMKDKNVLFSYKDEWSDLSDIDKLIAFYWIMSEVLLPVSPNSVCASDMTYNQSLTHKNVERGECIEGIMVRYLTKRDCLIMATYVKAIMQHAVAKYDYDIKYADDNTKAVLEYYVDGYTNDDSIGAKSGDKWEDMGDLDRLEFVSRVLAVE